ncbi:hypothetical protein PAMP_000048 [Pampus punctatissimus]
MFSKSNSCKVMAACMMVMMMMVLMMAEVTAMLKGGSHSRHQTRGHRKTSDSAIETVFLQLDPNTLVPTRNIKPLENSSISPWDYNVSLDDSLYPPVLSEAHCLLRGCLDKMGVEDLNLESKPIMHQVLLLRRVRSSGPGDSYHYRLESRLIAVGCTCVRPVIQHQH